MIVLLDLDDTVLLNGKLHPRFDDFRNWVMDGDHEVVVWSSHDDGEAIAELMSFSYLSKNDKIMPNADVLIDDSCHEFEKLCSVDISCSTLDSFLKLVQSGV